MAAGREADNHNLRGVDLVIPGPRPYQLHGAPRIQQRNREHIAVRSEPVTQNKSAKTAHRKPVGGLPALMVARQVDICAARKNHHGRTVFRAFHRLEDGQCWRVFAGLALGLGSVSRPQANGLDAQKIIVVAGHGTGLYLRLRRPARQQNTNQQSVKRSHCQPHHGSRQLYKPARDFPAAL